MFNVYVFDILLTGVKLKAAVETDIVYFHIFHNIEIIFW